MIPKDGHLRFKGLLLLILGTILLVGLATLLAALIPASRAAKIELLGFPAATPG